MGCQVSNNLCHVVGVFFSFLDILLVDDNSGLEQFVSLHF